MLESHGFNSPPKPTVNWQIYLTDRLDTEKEQ